MAETRTARLGLPTYSADTDSFGRTDFVEAMADVDSQAAIYLQGTRAARPAPGTAGRIYTVVGDGVAANNGVQFYDTGAAWVTVGAVLESVVVRPTAVGASGLVVQGLASQTAALLRVENSSAGELFSVRADGGVTQPGTGLNALGAAAPLTNVKLGVVAASAAGVPLVAKGAASQTGDLQQWRNSADSTLAKITAGGLVLADLAPSATAGAASSLGGNAFTHGGNSAYARLAVMAAHASMYGLLVRGTGDRIFAALDSASNAILDVLGAGVEVRAPLTTYDPVHGNRTPAAGNVAGSSYGGVPATVGGYYPRLWVESGQTDMYALAAKSGANGRVAAFVSPSQVDPILDITQTGVVMRRPTSVLGQYLTLDTGLRAGPGVISGAGRLVVRAKSGDPLPINVYVETGDTAPATVLDYDPPTATDRFQISGAGQLLAQRTAGHALGAAAGTTATLALKAAGGFKALDLLRTTGDGPDTTRLASQSNVSAVDTLRITADGGVQGTRTTADVAYKSRPFATITKTTTSSDVPHQVDALVAGSVHGSPGMSSTTPYEVTIGKAGRYRIRAKARWAAAASGRREIQVRNVGTGAIIVDDLISSASGGQLDHSLDETLQLTAGTRIAFRVKQTSGAPLDLDSFYGEIEWIAPPWNSFEFDLLI